MLVWIVWTILDMTTFEANVTLITVILLPAQNVDVHP